jgi:hypothetical protein
MMTIRQTQLQEHGALFTLASSLAETETLQLAAT